MRWLVLVLAVGCGSASSVADAVPGSDSGSDGGAASSGEPTTTWTDESSSSGADVIVPEACAFNPSFRCSAPFDCTEVDCGGLNTPFDTNGCLRLSCSGGAECPAAHHCVGPHEWGGDAWNTGGCDETADGGCDCEYSGWHSFPPNRYCVPIDEIPGGAATPQEYCAGMANAECIGDPLGICVWIRIVELLDSATCEMGQPYETCEALESPDRPAPPGDCPAAHYRELADGRIELTVTPLEPPNPEPQTWRACTRDRPGCACACDPGLP